jgi:stress-induced morphogen
MSGLSPDEIVRLPTDFIAQLGLQQSLTPSRNNGFLNMFKLMQKKALDIYMQQQQQQQQQPGAAGDAAAGDGPAASGSSGDGDVAVTAEQQQASAGDAAAAGDSSPSGTPVADSMRRKLTEELQPLRLVINDNSEKHAGHGGEHCARGIGGAHELACAAMHRIMRPTVRPANRLCKLQVLLVSHAALTSAWHAMPPMLRSPPSRPACTSAGYRGKAGYSGETHFDVELVSARFEGLTSIKRHRLVFKILEQEMQNPVHALSLVTKTPAEANMA